jgi:hypothetical protein
MLEMNLEQEISALHRMLPGLRGDQRTGWVVIVGEDFKGNFGSFEDAAAFAMDQFPSEDFLIRHTDAPIPQVPFVVLES